MKTSVLKVLCLMLVVLITATGLVTDVALSTPLFHGLLVTTQAPMTRSSLEKTLPSESPTPQASESSKSKGEAAKRTKQSTDSKAVNSDRAKSTPTRTQSPSAGPYDMERIKQFNRALYGS